MTDTLSPPRRASRERSDRGRLRSGDAPPRVVDAEPGEDPRIRDRRRSVQADRRHSQLPVRIDAAQPWQFGVVGRHPALEHLLRQWRAVVGLVRFIADDRQRSLETLLPQRFRGAQSGQRRADDDDTALGAELLDDLVHGIVAAARRDHSVSLSAGGSSSRMIACTGQDATARNTC